MTRLLIPDGQKEHANEVFWCLPIPTDLWNSAQAFHIEQTRNGVKFGLFRSTGEKPDVIIVFQNQRLEDDDAMAACAWIRFEQEAQETIYIVPHSRSQESITSLINRCMGVYRNRLISLDMYSAIPVDWINSKVKTEPQP